MPSTYTNILRLELQADGENDGTWGQILNDNVIALIDDAIGGTASISTTGGTTTLTTNDGAADQARNKMLDISGSLGSNAIIEVPALSKTYLVRNNTSGSFTVEILVNGQTAGAGVIVAQGQAEWVYCDGTDILPTNHVTGPNSTSDNALARFDGTTGRAVQGSNWLLEDDDELNAQDKPAYNTPLRLNGVGSTSNTVTVDLSSYSIVEFEPTADLTVDITNPSSNGRSTALVKITGGGDHALTFQVDSGNGTFYWENGSAPSFSTGSDFDIVALVQTGANEVSAKLAYQAPA
jgi:hypothetical protein